MERYDVAVIGAGPAGMMAGISASCNGNSVIILEQNPKSGKKLYITGKGRCNITNNCDFNEFVSNINSNQKFCYSFLRKFSNRDVMNFFEENGCPLKVERGNRVFPVSDKSSDIIFTLERKCLQNGVVFNYNERVVCITNNEEDFVIKTASNRIISKQLIIASGGKSYSATGSTGDGYKFAKMFGHTIIAPVGGLVGINLLHYSGGLTGLPLKNVQVSIMINDKIVASEFGEMLFTHSGVSGPIILTISSRVNRLDLSNAKLLIDFKPALSRDVLLNRIDNDININPEKSVKNMFKEYLPGNVIEMFLSQCNIPKETKMKQLIKAQINTLVDTLKCYVLHIKQLDDLDSAIVTSGGVNVKEISPKTLESKLCKGLYFCGEVMDIDALTGGFNLQLALSSGYCAGLSAGNKGGIHND